MVTGNLSIRNLINQFNLSILVDLIKESINYQLVRVKKEKKRNENINA